jgi:hypothetical protein
MVVESGKFMWDNWGVDGYVDDDVIIRMVQLQENKKVYEGHGAPARQTTCPDLLRLTRWTLLAAELLPWLDKGRLLQIQSQLTLRGMMDTKVFRRGQP